jgi:hypothetical protein
VSQTALSVYDLESRFSFPCFCPFLSFNFHLTHSQLTFGTFHQSPQNLFCSILLRTQAQPSRAMSPQPPVAIVTDGTLLNVPQDPPPPYPSRERRHRRRRTAVEASSADSDDLAYLDITHAPPHPHLDETAPLLGVSSPTRRARTMSLSSAASISPSLAQTVVSAFRMDLDSDGEDGEETTHDRSAVGTLPDDHLPHAPGLIRHRARGWRARWRHYFRPVGRRAYWSALFHLLVINFPYALLAWVYLFVFTLVSAFTS